MPTAYDRVWPIANKSWDVRFVGARAVLVVWLRMFDLEVQADRPSLVRTGTTGSV